MSVYRIRDIISKNVYTKALFAFFCIVLLILYFKAFFTTGVYFDDSFLKKEVLASDSHYIGKSAHGSIHITVKGLKNKHGSAEVIYRLPNNINKRYTVNFKNAGNWDMGIENIKDEAGNIVFEGEYRKDSNFLYDKDGKPMISDAVRIRANGEKVSYNANYRVSLKSVADFASFAKDTVHGKFELLFLAIVLFTITIIDIKFPLFFFSLRHALHVKDPEPSDFYIEMQRATWIVLPIIGVLLMIAAII